jgi:hypothetical protein
VGTAARKAGMGGRVWAQVIFKNTSAVALDTHTVRMQACVGKHWRAMFHYPIDPDFSPMDAIDQFCKDFFEFYEQAQAA